MKFSFVVLFSFPTKFLLIVVNGIIIKSKAHHIKGYTSLTDSLFITVPLCIGNPKQCFDLLYSNEKSSIIIHSPLSQKVKQTFDYTKSKSFEFIQKEAFLFEFKVLELHGRGRQFKDHIELNKNQNDENKFNMFLLNDINFNMVYFDGILGLYDPNIIDPSFSFLNYLSENDIASNMNFGHRFITRTQVDLLIGETPENIDNYTFCDSKNQAFWNCKLNSISFYLNNTIFRTYSSEVLIDTAAPYIKAPSPNGYDLFNLYLEAGNGHCKIAENSNLDSFIQCDKQVDIKYFPEIVFNLGNVSVRLRPSDVFDELESGELNGKIFIVDYNTFWVLNLVILKHYDIFFDEENTRIGFKENSLFENIKKEKDNDENKFNFKWFGFGIITVCFIGMGFSILFLWKRQKMFAKGKNNSNVIEQLSHKIVISQNLLNDIR